MKSKLTRSQEQVFELLQEQKEEISAQELYTQLRANNHQIGLATIYRVLKAMHIRGLIQARTSADGELLYTIAGEERHHLTCINCGVSQPIPHACPVGRLEEELRKTKKFDVYYHTLEFFGLCSLCSQEIKTSS